ncbi:YD repeat protein, partial [Ostertagia ostertagi]
MGHRPGPHARVVRHWTDDGEEYVFTYQFHADGGGTTTAKDALARTLQWEWNSDYELTRHTDALGSVTIQTWSETKHLLSHVDPLGRTTIYGYDDAGNLVAETDPLGRVQRWRWSPAPASLLISTSDATGAAWTYRYDDAGNLTAEIDPQGGATQYANNPQGLPVVVTDAHGGRKQLRWDSRALLTEYTDCSGKTTRFEYDKYGFLQCEMDAMGHRTALQHDPQGRLLKLTLPDGAEHRYSYDGAGQCVLAVDALGQSTSYSYNLRGQLTGRSKTGGVGKGADLFAGPAPTPFPCGVPPGAVGGRERKSHFYNSARVVPIVLGGPAKGASMRRLAEKKRHELDLLCRAGVGLTPIAPAVCRLVREIVGAEACALFWLDAQGQPEGFFHEHAQPAAQELFLNEFERLFLGPAEINITTLAQTPGARIGRMLNVPASYYRSNTYNLL